MRSFTIIFLLLLLTPIISYGNEAAPSASDSLPRQWSLNGYITNMQSFMFEKIGSEWTSDNLIHNRLNFKWNNRSNSLNVVVEVRNRIISGESVKIIPGYADMIEADNGFINLSSNLSTGNSYIFNSKVDRAYLDFTKEKFQLRVGRQRINWGQCFTWNPNDLFNAYSFLDFDYAEKPGSDAIRLQYYGNNTSTADFAIKLDKNKKVTAAALYRFNKFNYDIQIIGGILKQKDYVIGAGWSGNILDASFRGEVSYFHPTKNFADTSGVFSISLGSEYSFKNSFLLQFEMLYRQSKDNGIRSFADYYNMSLSAKNLSFTPFSLMVQGSYPITPLFNTSLSLMYFPDIKGFFIGPSLIYSLTENIDFSLFIQSFSGEFEQGRKNRFNMGFLRLKWNF